MSRSTLAVGANSPVKENILSGKVTCGPETAARLGVPVGTVIDLGVISYYHRNPIKRWWGRRKLVKRHPLN